MRIRVLHVPLVALPLVLAACGGNTPTADPASPGDGADVAGFCDAYADLLAAAGNGPDIDYDNSSDEEIAAAEAAFFENEVFPLLEDAQEAVGEGEITDALATMRSETEELGGGSFESPAFQEAYGVVGEFMFAECETDAEFDYQAVDYGYNNAPTEIPAGTVKLKFTNTGEEFHESVHLVKKAGVDKSWEEILELEEDEAMEYVDFLGAGFAAPGGSDYHIGAFEPGEHVFVCFVSVGSTPDASEGSEEGPPHFTKGMIHEFTVTG